MNIFVLDTNIERCARYHCDQHVVKMILESVQMLCTVLNKKGIQTPYGSTHQKHPCVLWVEQSYDNFAWLSKLALALNNEFKYRFDKEVDHKSIAVLDQIANYPDESYPYESRGLTEFAQAMPCRPTGSSIWGKRCILPVGQSEEFRPGLRGDNKSGV